jgi:hypothetical protein
MTFDSVRIDVAFGLLVVPFLIIGFPDLALSAFPAGEWLINVELRQ